MLFLICEIIKVFMAFAGGVLGVGVMDLIFQMVIKKIEN